MILIIALLFQGIIPISCSCGEGEEPDEWDNPISKAYTEKLERDEKEREEREKNFALLIERAALRKDGAPEEYINKVCPLPNSESTSNVNPADLPTQVEEIEEGADADTGGGGGGGGYGY